MTYLEALDIVIAQSLPRQERFRWLCSEDNADPESRDAYRALMIRKATGQPEPPERRKAEGERMNSIQPSAFSLQPFQRTIDPNTIITAERLAADTIELAAELPPDIDAVVAVARSGLMPGGLIASMLHVPMWAVSRACGVLDVGHGYRMGADFQPSDASAVRHLVIIDDTAATGREMPASVERVKPVFPGAKITRVVVYCHPQAVGVVDVYHSILPGPHYLSWNWPNAGHGAAAGYDFDGVLSAECPPGDDDDGPRYRNHLEHARPLYLPRRSMVPLIVSARHHSYRELCLAWLDRHDVQVRELLLRDFDYDPARSHDEQIGEWKAACYALSDCTLFAESAPAQAQIIAARSGKRVLCPALGRVIPGAAAVTVKGGCCN